MGVVRILAGSVGFSALDYNFFRVKNMQGEVLSYNLFPDVAFEDGVDISRLRNYLNTWNSSNGRMKNRQFHATISVRGNELTKQQLNVVGKQWLAKMGYGDNPYIIVFHNNTRNNHIHIVTTRVGRNGKKIDDKFEKIRAVKILDEIMGVDRTAQMRHAILNYLKYSYSTRNQFFSLLEKEGFYIKPGATDEAPYRIMKSGKLIYSLNPALLDWCQRRYFRSSMDNKYKAKIRALLIKYAQQANNVTSLNDYLHKNFGLVICMYGGKDGKGYYGYSIIDHSNKRVMKGGEFLNVKFLCQLLEQNVNISDANSYIQDLLAFNHLITQKEINQELRKLGLRIVDGEVIRFTGVVMGEVAPKLQQKIDYNGKLCYYNSKYHPVTPGELSWVSRKFDLNLEDLQFFIKENQECRAERIQYYFDNLTDMLKEDGFSEALHLSGIHYSSEGDETIFYDESTNEIFSSALMDPDMQEMISESLGVNYQSDSQHKSGVVEDDGIDIHTLLAGLSPSKSAANSGGSGTQEKKKKKKRKL